MAIPVTGFILVEKPSKPSLNYSQARLIGMIGSLTHLVQTFPDMLPVELGTTGVDFTTHDKMEKALRDCGLGEKEVIKILTDFKEPKHDPKYAAKFAADFSALQKRRNDIQKEQNEAEVELRRQFHDSFSPQVDLQIRLSCQRLSPDERDATLHKHAHREDG